MHIENTTELLFSKKKTTKFERAQRKISKQYTYNMKRLQRSKPFTSFIPSLDILCELSFLLSAMHFYGIFVCFRFLFLDFSFEIHFIEVIQVIERVFYARKNFAIFFMIAFRSHNKEIFLITALKCDLRISFSPKFKPNHQKSFAFIFITLLEKDKGRTLPMLCV